MTAQLTLDGVSVAYAKGPVVTDVSLALDNGTLGCFLGPSGCGKTTLLRAIAGFEPVTAGEIAIGGRVVSRLGETQAPESRQVGMVFQDFALFPHMSVADNVGFGLRRWKSAQRSERIEQLLALVGLGREAGAYPHQLSGGQQQRVALARAMAPRPAILLLDEPFSSIDTELREQLATEVRAMLLREGITAVLVTHNQHEAFAMADVVGVFGDGRLRQWDTPYRLYHQPSDRFVADFIGRGVMIEGTAIAGGGIETPLGTIAGTPSARIAAGHRVHVLLRPDDLIHDDASPIRLAIVKRTFRGSDFLYTLALPDGTEVLCLVPSHHDLAAENRLGVRLDVRHLAVFPPTDNPAAAT